MLLSNGRPIDLQAKLFRGFSDPSRLAIIQALRGGTRTVGEIVHDTGLSQSNVSNHLSCLRDCGLVTATPQGRFVSYALSDERIEQLLRLVDELLADTARHIYECTRYQAAPSSEDTRLLEGSSHARS